MALTAADISVQHEKSTVSTTESGPSTSAGAWDLRHPGCIMRGGQRRGDARVYGHVAPQARCRPRGAHGCAEPRGALSGEGLERRSRRRRRCLA